MSAEERRQQTRYISLLGAFAFAAGIVYSYRKTRRAESHGTFYKNKAVEQNFGGPLLAVQAFGISTVITLSAFAAGVGFVSWSLDIHSIPDFSIWCRNRVRSTFPNLKVPADERDLGKDEMMWSALWQSGVEIDRRRREEKAERRRLRREKREAKEQTEEQSGTKSFLNRFLERRLARRGLGSVVADEDEEPQEANKKP